MDDKILLYKGEKYYLDIDAIMNWCLSSSKNIFKETEINEGYDTNNEGEIQLSTKLIRELKTNNQQDETIRYDFIKLLLSPFIMGTNVTSKTIEDMFTYNLLFNTFVNMGFLHKIND